MSEAPDIVSPTTFIVADGHEFTRRGVVAELNAKGTWKVAGEAANGADALLLCGRLQPAVLVLDVDLPEVSGLDVLRSLSSESPRTRAVVLTSENSEEVVRDVLAAGALAYVLKSDAAADLMAAVESVLNGRPFFTAGVSQAMLNEYLGHRSRPAASALVTLREKQVVDLVTRGLTSKEIATTLGIAVRTVETHRRNILDKLGLHSARELLVYAARQGWVDYCKLPVPEQSVPRIPIPAIAPVPQEGMSLRRLPDHRFAPLNSSRGPAERPLHVGAIRAV